MAGVHFGMPCMWLLFLTTLPVLVSTTASVIVDRVTSGATHAKIGAGGAVTLTISGSNLKEAFQVTAAPGDGYVIMLASDDQLEAYTCNILPGYTAADGTSIVCSTTASPPGWYNLQLKVDGVTATHSTPSSLQVLESYTPTIDSVVVRETLLSYVPRVGQVFVEVRGRTLTSYINGTEFGERNSTNGITARLIAVYVDQYLCDKTDKDGLPLPIQLDGADGESKYGTFTVLCHARSIGNHNITFIIGEEFGRSTVSYAHLCVNSNNEIGIWETYPVILTMDKHAGSPSGGTVVTMTGLFGSTTSGDTSDIDVLFAGVAGTVTSRTYDTTTAVTTLTVTTAAENTTGGTSYWPGGRGVKVELWNQTAAVANHTEADAVRAAGAPDSTEHPDASSFTHTGLDDYLVGRMSFYYVPAATGLYGFYMETCNDAAASPAVSTAATLSLSETDRDPTAKVLLLSADHAHVSAASSRNPASMKNLTVGEAYYVEVNFYGTNGACVKISVFTCETIFNMGQACGAYNQKEDIVITSTILTEIQTLDFSTWPALGSGATPTHTFTITIVTAGTQFRLSIAKSYTVPIRSEDASTIQEHLRQLPTLGSTETVTVTGTSPSFTVTITSENGPFTLEAADEHKGATTAVTVTGSSTSVTGQEWVFSVDGYRSPPIDQRASDAEVATAISTLLSVRCPTIIPPAYLGSSNAFHYDDCEGSSESCQEEPFCGSKSCCTLRSYIDLYNNKNPSVSAHTVTHVGFAYKFCGCNLKSYIYYHANVVTDTHNFTWWRSVPYNFTSDCEWDYTVLDLKAQVLEDHDNWIPTGTESSVKMYVDIIRVHRNDRCTDPRAPICVDEIYVGLPDSNVNITDLPLLRAVPPMRSKMVTVTKTADVYSVEIEPCDCEALNTLTVEGTASWVNINATQKATVAVGGTFSLSLGSETLNNISVSISEQDLKKELESNFDIGKVDVERIDRYNCNSFKFRVTYLTKPGCQSPLTVNDSSLTGNSPAIAASVIEYGGLYQDITGSFLRFTHPQTETQANLFINKLPARCEDDALGNCTFKYDASLEATFATVAPTTGTVGAILTISGTGFDDAVHTNNRVTIGSANCLVTAATTTQLTCTLEAGPAGQYPLQVAVSGQGNARATTSPAASFTITIAISSIGPSSGSIVGCTLLTVTGEGFDSTATVTVGGAGCPIADTMTDITPTTIKCRVPARGSAGAVDVEVTVRGETATYSSYTYDATPTYTPTITGLSPSTASATGGDVLTITGSGFGTAPPEVTVGDRSVTLGPHSDTNIEVTLPALPPGANAVKVFVPNKGCAAQSGVLPDVTVTFAVSKVCPTVCSAYGGCTFTIEGGDFPSPNPATYLQVTVGGIPCRIDDASSTASRLVCTLDRVSRQHEVNYVGGINHRWEPRHTEVEVGDCITWRWTTSTSTNLLIKVQQIGSASSTTPVPGGFESAASAIGEYTWCFDDRDSTIYFWSTYIDSYPSISFSGTVAVVARQPITAPMVISVRSDTTVQPNTGSLTTCTNPTPCPPIIGTCGTPGTGLNIQLDPCYSPTVTNQAVSTYFVPLDITLTGSNFGTSSACVEVTLGSHATTVSTTSTTSIVANLPSTSEARANSVHDVVLNFIPNGFPLIAGEPTMMQVAIVAVVQTVSVSVGSTAGCTDLTISGQGFQNGETQVTIDGVVCQISSVDYDSINCRTGAHSGGPYQIDVLVDGIAVTHNPTAVTFEYQTASTPTVTSVSPASPATVGAGATITITGTLFGSSGANVEVNIGTYPCTGATAAPTTIECTAPNLPAINLPVTVRIDNLGCADVLSSVQVIGTPTITNSIPTTGSIHGGVRLTVNGNGFDPAGTAVEINGNPFTSVVVISSTQLTCIAPANLAGTYPILVTIPAGFPAGPSFTYDMSLTPMITNLQVGSSSGTAVTGVAGDTLTITGSGFSATAADNSVLIGTVSCSSPMLVAGNIECTVGSDVPGTYGGVVTVDNSGSSDASNTFTHELTLTTVSPTSGSTAGGTLVTFTGNGIFNTTTVTVCGNSCTGCTKISGGVVCTTPPGVSGVCDVSVTHGNTTQTLSNAYTYDPAKTPDISALSHRRGGTAGGVTLTMSGTNFGTDCSNLTVTVDNIDCNVTSCNDTAVVCVTGPVPRTVAWTTRCTDAMTARQNIQLHRSTCGYASMSMVSETCGFYSGRVNAHGALGADFPLDPPAFTCTSENTYTAQALNGRPAFQYVDVWSSPYTWGGGPLPTGGDLVVIPEGQAILLDTSTPVLKLVLIQGCLIFEDAGTPTLEAEYILITNGGLMQVGTEDDPYCNGYATIRLHGGPRSQELPIYGAKVIGVRNGTLDLHGCPTPTTWMSLDQTVQPGDDTIRLLSPVNWQVNDSIIITTTHDHRSQKETEKRKITAISADGRTLTLNTPLVYKHIADTETFADGSTFTLRADVGLLTHNVLVSGSNDTQFNTAIPACPQDFNPDRFATQSCAQGMFGAEVGSDEYGVHILVHSARPDTYEAVARIEHTEITYAGQAYRLGRYPVHFHNIGNTSSNVVCNCTDNNAGSYIRSCSIHESFNRAINVHGTHGVLVTNNVVYHIKGGAIFLEDSVEMCNIFSYNLIVFVIPSSSLQVDDLTPAAFWITNPVNCVNHNHAIGNSAFGFWYRIEEPQGSNQHVPIHPINQNLLQFYNNTACFNGRYGLWVFEFYFPVPGPAVFHTFTACYNLRGAEFGDVGKLQAVNFVLVHNYLAGMEMLLIYKQYVPCSDRYDKSNGPALLDSVIVSELFICPARPLPTKLGLVLPLDSGLIIDNVKFINFGCGDNEGSRSSAIGQVKITCTCSNLCGAYEAWFSNISWVNTTCRSKIEWEHQFALVDLDGTLTGNTSTSGVAGSKVVPVSDLLPASCVKNVPEWSSGGPYAGAICPANVYFIKLNFNNVIPGSLEYKNVLIQNTQGGTTIIIWRKLSRDYKKGYFALLPVYKNTEPCENYTMWFENAEHISNISYKAQFTGFQNTCIIMSHNVTQNDTYDQIGILLSNNPGQSAVPLSSSSTSGQWTFVNKIFSYQLSAGPTHCDIETHVKAEKCFYVNCTVPVDPASLPPSDTRPATFCLWSDPYTWNTSSGCGCSWVSATGVAGVGVPTVGAKVTIGTGYTVLDINGTMPCFNSIVIQKGGTLEVEPFNNVIISAFYIVIEGGGRLIIGREGDPATGQITICLKGDHSTPDYTRRDGPIIGAKVLAVFGCLDLHGTPQDPQWVSLTVTANAGANQIHINANVSGQWQVGDEIVIAPTGYSPWQAETFSITAISASGTTLTLNATLEHKHLAYNDTACAGAIAGACVMAAEVGHLTRNIKIIGCDGDCNSGTPSGLTIQQSFGARVLIGLQTDFTTSPATAARGCARLSNVQFIYCGQEGYIEKFDARCAVAYIDTGTVTDVKPSYIKSCAFSLGLAQVVCVYGAANFSICNNVIYISVGQGIKTDAVDLIVKGNLVILSMWPGAYQNRLELTNKNLEGAIEVNQALNVLLQDNAVAGCERLGYRMDGESCYVASTWSNNSAHTGIIGVGIIPALISRDVQDGFPGENCSKISGFRVWRMWGFGSYTQTGHIIIVANSMFCENGVSVFNMVVGPGIKSHAFANKFVRVENCTFVGRAPGFDCAADKPDTSSGGADADNVGLAGVFIKRCQKEGMSGICSLFTSGGNLFPFKPLILAKVQPAMIGITYIDVTCFAHFNLTCSNRGRDTMLAYNQLSKDMDFPFKTSQITRVNVDDSSITYMPYPDSSTAKAEQCGTLACDGPRKFIIKDLDGSLLGCVGSLLPDADYQWNGNTSFGLGDYRIPYTMMVDVYGRKLNISEIYQLRGIIGTDGAPWDATSQTYKVCDQDYEWFSTESLDSDFKTRLISPTVVRSKNVTTNMTHVYITAEPSDAGICGGYPCMERPQYQWMIIATGQSYEVFYTGSTPQNMRIHFPGGNSSQSFQVCIYNPSAQRLDVHVVSDQERYILPINGYYANGAIAFYSRNYNWFRLSITGNATGANIYDYDTKMLCIIVRGPNVIVIKTSPAVLFKSGLQMTVDEFFGKHIVQNLALFLGLPAHKVRVVSIVSPLSVSGRKRRSVNDLVDVIIQITDSPPDSGDTQSLDYTALTNVYNLLAEGFQTGALAEALGNVTFTYFILSPPLPSHDTQAYADLVALADSNGVQLGGDTSITVPDRMELYDAPIGGYEGGLFAKYAAARVLDAEGGVVTVLVSNGKPWTLTARLYNYNGQASLMGNTTIEFTNGWAIFSDLTLSDPGTYSLAFELTHPSSFKDISLIISPTPVIVTKRPLSLHPSVVGMVTVKEDFQIALVVQDPSGAVVTDLNWKGHSWAYTLRLHSAFVSNLDGSLSGSLNSNGLTTSSNLTLDKTGYFAVEVMVSSQPAGYDLQAYALVNVLPANYIQPTVETTATLSITFDVNSSVLLQPGAFKAHFANQLQSLVAAGTIISNITIMGTGPYTVGFVVSGTEVAVNATLNSLGSYVNQSCPALTWLNVTLTCSTTLLVNGTPYYSLPTTASPKPAPADITLPLVLGICIPVGVILIIAIIVLCVIKRSGIKGKPLGGMVSDTPEPGRKEGATTKFTSQSGLLSSRAASMISTNPAGKSPDETSFSSTDSSANSSPSLHSASGLLANAASTSRATPSPRSATSAAELARSATPPKSAKRSWKSRLSLSRQAKKGKPLQVTPRGEGSTPPPAEYIDPATLALQSEDSACSQSSKQGVTVAYSPREISFNMSDVS